jgi:phosphonate transport system substrate-binding protein
LSIEKPNFIFKLFALEEDRMKKRSPILVALLGLVILTMLVTACAPAATPTAAAAPTQAVQAPAATDTVAAPAATDTVAAPTIAPTVAPTTPATVAPTVAPTIPAAVCAPLPNPPTVKAGDLGSSGNPIVITFVPSGDSGKIATAGNAIADCLGKMTGLSFKIEVGTSFGASIEAMGANKAQVGFLNTFSVLLAEQKYQIIPALASLRNYTTNAIDPDKALAGQIEPFYRGEFIASVSSGIKTIADLKGKTFCFVDPNSTSGYIVPHIVLAANGINPDKDFKATQNAGSHNNVAIAVYKGDCDAGSAYIDILTDPSANLKATYPDIAQKVAPFYDTDRIPNDGVQYVKTLDPKIQSIVSDGLVAMGNDPGGQAVLKSLYTIAGFQKIDTHFYDAFAAILKKAGVDPATLVK